MLRTGLFSCFFVVNCAVAMAQTPTQTAKPEGAKAEPPPVEVKFSGRSEEVSLDLVVRDKHGKPIRDLKPEEIEILDDGHPAKVRSLLPAGGKSSSAETVELPGQSPAARRPADPLKQVHLVSLLFESLDVNASKMAKEGAYELLKGISSPNTYMAVLRVSSRVQVAQGFTNDREPLKKAIDSLTTPGRLNGNSEIAAMEEQLRHQAGSQAQFEQLQRGDVSSLAGVGQSPGDPMSTGMALLLLDVMETSRRVTRDQHARPAIASILGVVRTMARLPGRKVVVYFSQGLPLSEGAVDEFERLVGEANRAGVTVYTVDPSGLDPDATSGDNSPFTSGPSGGLGQGRATDSKSTAVIKRQSQTADRINDAIHSNAHRAMIDLASATGGSFMGNTNDLKKPMHKLVEDEETYYLAYYSPHIEGYDGHFRTIMVKINRPGATVQTRSGYFALPPTATPLHTFELPMLKALNDKTGQPDPLLRSHAFEFPGASGTLAGELAVEIPLSHLQVRENAGERLFHLHFSVLALIRGADGNIVGQFSEDVPFRAAAELKASTLAGTFFFGRPFHVEPGKYTLDVAVYDFNSDKVTVTQSAFESKAPVRPALSEPLIVAKLEPLPQGAAADSADPLVYQGSRVTPQFLSQVRNDSGSALPVFFTMYPDSSSDQKPLLAVQVRRASGALLANVPMVLKEPAGPGPAPFIASIPTHSLDPGDYLMRVVYTQGSARAEREMPFSVQGETRKPAVKPPADAQMDGSTAPFVVAHTPRAFRLAPEDQSRMIDGARERALRYTASLPNFTVRESTRREISKTGAGGWNPRDAFTEVVRFTDGVEERKLIEWNGQKSDVDRSSLDGMMLNGEFGFLLAAVFKEQTQAKFAWKESVETSVCRCEVFSFKVDRAHSLFRLRTRGKSYMQAAYDGEVYLDAATFHIRRVTLRTPGLPKEFPVRSTVLRVDYDMWRSGQGDHLVPVSGVIEVQTKRAFERNEVQFKDYRRLGSESTIKFAGVQ